MNRNFSKRKLFLLLNFLLWAAFIVLISHTLLPQSGYLTDDPFSAYITTLAETFYMRAYLFTPFIAIAISMYVFLFRNFALQQKVKSPKSAKVISFIWTLFMFTISSLIIGGISFSVRFFFLSQKTWHAVNSTINTAVNQTSTNDLRKFIDDQSSCDFISYAANGGLAQTLFINKQKELDRGTTFYTGTFLPAQDSIYFKTKYTSQLKEVPVVILNNRLYFQKIELTTWSSIAPKLGAKLTSCAMSSKKLKAQPRITVLDEQAYLDKETKALDKYIVDINKNIAQLKKSISITSSWLNSIVAYGNRYGYTADMLANKKAAEKYLAEYKALLATAQEYLRRANEREFTVTDEIGNYTPPNNITLLYSPKFDETPNIYVETLIHEQFHYQSDIPGKELPDFFEEGLTQFFTLRALKASNLPVSSTTYPLAVFLVQQMTNKIPIEQWEKIYYAKDTKLLESTLDAAYGKGFYKNNLAVMQSLTFSSTLESLQRANGLSDKIGGRYLSEEEFGRYKGE